MEKYLPCITAIIAIGGFVFSVWKYIDLKNREEKRLNYENFNKILNDLSGTMLQDGRIKIEISFLIGNIYKMLEFPKYKEISLPVLKYLKEHKITDNPIDSKHIDFALNKVIEKLV